MAFKMKGSPMYRNFVIGPKQNYKTGKTEAEKLAERKAKRKAEGKPVGVGERVSRLGKGMDEAVSKVTSKVSKVAKGADNVVKRAGGAIDKAVASRKAKRKANQAHRRAVDAWRAGGSKGPMPTKKS